jgi:hypothetical protein
MPGRCTGPRSRPEVAFRSSNGKEIRRRRRRSAAPPGRRGCSARIPSAKSFLSRPGPERSGSGLVTRGSGRLRNGAAAPAGNVVARGGLTGACADHCLAARMIREEEIRPVKAFRDVT